MGEASGPRSSRASGRLDRFRLKRATYCLVQVGMRWADHSPFASRGHSPEPSIRLGVSTLLRTSQRASLHTLFQQYVARVTVPGKTSDLMRRSTWFRFLHHCGLLGPEGVPLGQAAASFALYTETAGGVDGGEGTPMPMLSFGNWANAMQHLLRGPKFHRSDEEAAEAMLSTYAGRCRDRVNAGAAPPAKPASARDNAGLLAWQAALAEEQMCEPEVLQTLYDFQAPLLRLFAHYARRGRAGAAGAGGTGDAQHLPGRPDGAAAELPPEEQQEEEDPAADSEEEEEAEEMGSSASG